MLPTLLSLPGKSLPEDALLNLSCPTPDWGEGFYPSVCLCLILNAACDVRGDLGEHPTGVYAHCNLKGQLQGRVIASAVGAAPGRSPGITGAIFPPSARSGGQAAVNNGVALPWLY